MAEACSDHLEIWTYDRLNPIDSKITLAEASLLMQNMGYKVSTALIPVGAPMPA